MNRRKINDALLLKFIDAGKSQKEIAEFFGVSPAAVCKRLKKLRPAPDLSHLTPKQREFVLNVAKGNSLTDSAMVAYDCKDRKSASAVSAELMRKPEITMSIAELMDYHGLSHSYRISRLKQHVDNPDPHVSLKALDMSFKLDNTYPPQRSVNFNVDVYKIDPVDLSRYVNKEGSMDC